ncbi:hypothetical protein KKA14_19360, partial [bacterium]|nr:hypothetical protein [bacterium]
MNEPETADLLNRVTGYYNQKLKKSPQALDYLRERGIVHPDAIDQFQMGYSDNTLHSILPASKTKKGGEIRDQLKRLGVIGDDGKESLKGCLTVPLK